MVGARSIALRGASMRRGVDPGGADHQRHADEHLVELEAVAQVLVLAERLAVVAGDHDGRALAPGLRRDELEELADVLVGEGHLGVVLVARRLP